MPTREQGNEVELLLKQAAQDVEQGEIGFDDLVGRVAQPAPPVVLPGPLPLPAAITKKQREALARLTEVFGKVVPAERRLLTPTEAGQLLVERETLTEIEKMAEDRKAGIRLTVLNHNDVAVEERLRKLGKAGEQADILRDKDGHYAVKAEVRAEEGSTEKLTVEPRKGTVTLDPDKLRDLADNPDVDWFTHDDYIAMTVQTRAFNEHRAMAHLRANPHLVRAIREATNTGVPSISVNARKA